MLTRLVARGSVRASTWLGLSSLRAVHDQPGAADLSHASLGELKIELERASKEREMLRAQLAVAADPNRKTVLMLGAGRSSTALIQYLLNEASEGGWRLKLGDASLAEAQRKVGAHEHGLGFRFDGNSEVQLSDEVARADLVISLLPVTHHERVLRQCLKHGKPMLTASYASNAIMRYDAEARAKGVLVLMECGLDPGIDHMSAMRMLDEIRAAGGRIDEFQSHTGGLIADECDNNPWKYKFTWNPRNVVLAGSGVSEYLQRGAKKYIPYHKVFERVEKITLPDTGALYEGYANRNSLTYINVYRLNDCPTIIRGTLRKPGFCSAWNIFVRLGMTDDSFVIEDCERLTYAQFLDMFLPYRPRDSVELKLCYITGMPLHAAELDKLRWLGMFSDRRVGLKRGTPAQILEHILSRKWVLSPTDKDLIVMVHRVRYTTAAGEARSAVASLTCTGDGEANPDLTAMAKTVGYPVAIAARLILQGKIKRTGVTLPVEPDIYNPILDELDTRLNIRLTERHQDASGKAVAPPPPVHR